MLRFTDVPSLHGFSLTEHAPQAHLTRLSLPSSPSTRTDRLSLAPLALPRAKKVSTWKVSATAELNFVTKEVEAAETAEFLPAKVIAVQEVAPGLKRITLDAEISREFVPLSNAYTTPGQNATIQLSSSSSPVTVHVSSPPFPSAANHEVLYKLKGDIPAGAMKAPQYALSVHAPLDLHVLQDSLPDVYSLSQGDEVQLGPFTPTGMNLRPIMFIARFPTLLVFASGVGVAAAKALIEAEDTGSMSLSLRSDVRLYYLTPSPAEMPYMDCFDLWQSKSVKVKTIASTVPAGTSWSGFTGTFASAFDEDDLEYDPETTAAVVCGPKDKNAEALAVLAEAGIPDAQIAVWEC